MKCMNETPITVYLQKPMILGMTQITTKVFTTLQKVKITKSISLQSSVIIYKFFLGKQPKKLFKVS